MSYVFAVNLTFSGFLGINLLGKKSCQQKRKLHRKKNRLPEKKSFSLGTNPDEDLLQLHIFDESTNIGLFENRILHTYIFQEQIK